MGESIDLVKLNFNPQAQLGQLFDQVKRRPDRLPMLPCVSCISQRPAQGTGEACPQHRRIPDETG